MQPDLLGPHPDVLEYVDRGRVRLVADGEPDDVDAGVDRASTTGTTTTASTASAAYEGYATAATTAAAATTTAASAESTCATRGLENHLLSVDDRGCG